MGWGLWRRRDRAARQRVLPFLERVGRRERWFKRAIVGATLLAAACLVGGTRVGRSYTSSIAAEARLFVIRQAGAEPERAEIDALQAIVRARTVDETRESLRRFYRDASPALRRLFDATGMDPDHALIGSGRARNAFLLSPQVFEADAHGRSYRLRPGVRSVWLRQITLSDGPFGLFLVRDVPEVIAAATAAGAVVDETSRQTTNSWGLRGPEPDPSASLRVVVLGDSFMQGMFNGEADAPPRRLEQALRALWGKSVSVLNTGHIGYAPEQYFHTLREYGERFRPDFVVMSVCPNDFGNDKEVLEGAGDEWGEAAYWLEQAAQWCRGRAVRFVLAPVPTASQINGVRRDGHYPAPVCDLFMSPSTSYCDMLDAFVDEHLRLSNEALRQRGLGPRRSLLYNEQINDNHFSPLGADLWARIVARRLDLIRQRHKTEPDGGGTQ